MRQCGEDNVVCIYAHMSLLWINRGHWFPAVSLACISDNTLILKVMDSMLKGLFHYNRIQWDECFHSTGKRMTGILHLKLHFLFVKPPHNKYYFMRSNHFGQNYRSSTAAKERSSCSSRGKSPGVQCCYASLSKNPLQHCPHEVSWYLYECYWD